MYYDTNNRSRVLSKKTVARKVNPNNGDNSMSINWLSYYFHSYYGRISCGIASI